MIPSISVIVPYRETDEYRALNLARVSAHLADVFPDAELVIADAPGPFSRGRALNAGVTASRGEVLVLADADMLIPWEPLHWAVGAAPEASYVAPSSFVLGLSAPASARARDEVSFAGPWLPGDVEYALGPANPNPNTWLSGGCTVMMRRHFDLVGGFDETIEGWGSEDAIFAAVAETLVGPAVWIAAVSVHLWHPIAETRVSGEFMEANRRLVGLYEAARGDKYAMRNLMRASRARRGLVVPGSALKSDA